MIPLRAWIYAGLIAALLALAGWWHLSRVHAAERAVHAHYAAVLAEISARTAKAAAEFRATEQAWQIAFDKEARDGQKRIAAARLDADAAHAVGERMRAAIDRYRAAARATQDTGAADAGPPAADAIGVFADMLEELDRRAGIYAETADVAHAAGMTCERSFDALEAK